MTEFSFLGAAQSVSVSSPEFLSTRKSESKWWEKDSASSSFVFYLLLSHVLLQGPDGIGDYRPRSNYFPRYIGVGASSSPEATGDLSYLWRAAAQARPPLPRQSCVGEVGWCWQYNQLLNSRTLHSNMQIKVQLKSSVYANECLGASSFIWCVTKTHWAWLWGINEMMQCAGIESIREKYLHNSEQWTIYQMWITFR